MRLIGMGDATHSAWRLGRWAETICSDLDHAPFLAYSLDFLQQSREIYLGDMPGLSMPLVS